MRIKVKGQQPNNSHPVIAKILKKKFAQPFAILLLINYAHINIKSHLQQDFYHK